MRIKPGLAALAALAVIAPTAGAATPWYKRVHSVPGFTIPRVFTTIDDPDKSPGYIFLSPRAKPGQRTGPTILDADGRVVWFHRLAKTRTAINLRPQTYLGKPVLTWGQRPPLVDNGDFYTGSFHTVYNVIADQRYHIIARVRARGRGIKTDLHEFQITRRNTALVLGFRTIQKNLSRYHGLRKGFVLDNVVQEIDIKSGKVLFEWSAARRLSPAGSAIKPPEKEGGWDAYHVNSVSEDTDGNLLVTVRHMSEVLKLDRHDGHVIWRLGGAHSSFRVSSNARFYYPHDAQRAPDGTITIFDNRSTAIDKSRGSSRAVRIRIDTSRKTASLAREYRHPTGTVFSTSQGNVDELSGKSVFVGWGASPWWSEYAPDGHLVFAGHFQSAWNQSYRAYKAPWTGMPDDLPSVRASIKSGSLIAYASWNGATEVRQWQFLTYDDAANLVPLGTVDWQGFETKVTFPTAPKVIAVRALDANGKILESLPAVAPAGA
jgi:hypothetical protein